MGSFYRACVASSFLRVGQPTTAAAAAIAVELNHIAVCVATVVLLGKQNEDMREIQSLLSQKVEDLVDWSEFSLTKLHSDLDYQLG
jgi:hypothetical protein